MIYLLCTAVLVYKTLWKFVLSDGFKIEIDEDYQGIKKHWGKKCIGKDLTSLNYVQKYLKAVTLVDIISMSN